MLASHAALATRRRAAVAAVAVWLVASAPMLMALLEHLTTFKTQVWIGRPDLAALVQLLWVLGGCGRISLLVWGLALLGLVVHLAPRLEGALLGQDAALPLLGGTTKSPVRSRP